MSNPIGAGCPGISKNMVYGEFHDYLISIASMVVEIVILLVSVVVGCKFSGKEVKI